MSLNSELGAMRDVKSDIISHEQTQSTRVCCYKTLDAVCLKGLLQIITSIICIPQSYGP